MRRIGCTLALLALLASPVTAWWDAGHKITASIAWQRLTPSQRERVIALLKPHPRWQPDFANQMPETIRSESVAVQEEWAFQQASVWADLARDFQGDDRKSYHRGTWHYVNQPLFLTPDDRIALSEALRLNVETVPPPEPRDDMNVLQTLALARRLTADEDAAAATRAVMLAWIFHIVGDLHQPLHTSTLVSRQLFPAGCRGGNLIKTKQRENLHALWDSLPGERMAWRAAHNRAITLMQDAPLKALGEAAAGQLDHLVWARESRELVEEVVFAPEVLAVIRAAEAAGEQQPPEITLTEEYLHAAGRIAERRVVQGGYRLGAVLAEIVR